MLTKILNYFWPRNLDAILRSFTVAETQLQKLVQWQSEQRTFNTNVMGSLYDQIANLEADNADLRKDTERANRIQERLAALTN